MFVKLVHQLSKIVWAIRNLSQGCVGQGWREHMQMSVDQSHEPFYCDRHRIGYDRIYPNTIWSLSPWWKVRALCSEVFCFGAVWYIVKLWHLHRFRFEPTLITVGCSVEECAIDPAMDPMGRRQHSPSWAWDWCFCCRSSSWPVPSWLLIVHRVQWFMPQSKCTVWLYPRHGSASWLSLAPSFLEDSELMHWCIDFYGPTGMELQPLVLKGFEGLRGQYSDT